MAWRYPQSPTAAGVSPHRGQTHHVGPSAPGTPRSQKCTPPLPHHSQDLPAMACRG